MPGFLVYKVSVDATLHVRVVNKTIGHLYLNLYSKDITVSAANVNFYLGFLDVFL
jgi:hypothetical protein